MIGTVEHLKNPAFDDMVEFHRTWYVPNNMALVLVGAVEPRSTLAMLEKEFGSWEPRPLPTSLPGHITPLTKRVEKVVTDKGQQSVNLAWLLPRGEHDAATWDVIRELIGDERSGLLHRDLVLTQKLPWADVSFFEMKDASCFRVEAGLADKQTHAEAEALIVDVLRRVVAGDFPDDLLASIVLNKRVADALQAENAEDRAYELTQAYTKGFEWRDQVERMRRRATVTKADIMREAKARLGDAFVAVHRKEGTYVPPKVDKPTITPVPIGSSELGAYARSILDRPVVPLEPRWLEEGRDYTRGRLPTGPVIAAHNDASDLFEVSYVFEGGKRRDPLLCYALDGLALAGSKTLDATAVQNKLYRLAATVQAACDNDLAALWVSGIDANLEVTLAFVNEWLADPRFAAAEVARLNANELRLRREKIDQKEVRQQAAKEYLLWGRDSVYLAELPNRRLLATTPAAMSTAVRQLTTSGHKTYYFGPRPLSAVVTALPFGRGKRAAPAVPPHHLVRSSAPEIMLVPFPSAEARIHLSFPSGPASTDERAVARMFSEFIRRHTWEEIREARGLAYSINAQYTLNDRSGDDSGAFVSVASQADKVPETLRVLLSLFADFRPTASRFESAKASIEAIYRTERIPPRSVPSRVDDWDRLGVATDPRPHEWNLLGATTHEALTTFSLRATQRPYRLIVIGDPGRLDMKALGAIAPVRQVAPESLFAWGPFPAGAEQPKPPAP